jgi:hypothetical protein
MSRRLGRSAIFVPILINSWQALPSAGLMNFVSRRDKAMVDRKSDLKNGVAIAFPVYSNILTLRN